MRKTDRISRLITKWIGWSVFLIASNVNAATLTVSPPSPYTFDSVSGTPRMYIATTTITAAQLYYTSNEPFKRLDISTNTAATSTTILMTVSNIPTDKEYLQFFAVTSSGHMVAPVIVGSTSPGDSAYPSLPAGYYYSVKTNGNTDVSLYINLKAICEAGGSGVMGCNGAAVSDATAAGDWGFQLKAMAVDTPEYTTTVPSDFSSAYSFLIYPESNRGTTACSGAAPYFFPAEGAITVDPGRFTFAADSAGSSAVKYGLLVMADTTAFNFALDTWASNDLVLKGLPSGEQNFSGFTNYEPPTLTTYSGGYAFIDSAGVVTSTACTETVPMVAGSIASFLKESNCFIAAASFRDENAPPVLLLRKFRDHVLAKFHLGRRFIGFYYTDGPKAADWLLNHSVFRPLALGLLIPLQVLAWISLHPAILWIPFFALILLVGFFRPKTLGFLPLIALVFSQTLRADEARVKTPYLDTLMSEIEPDVKRTDENPDPYIQSLKKKMEKKSGPTGYTEEEGKELEPDSSKGYTDRIQKEIGPGEHKSAIADFYSGKKLKENRGDTTAKGSFGFRLLTSANRTYRAGSAEETSYDQAYGDKWAPDLLFTFEKRPFKGWAANRLGVQGGLGFSWVSADARFSQNLPNFGSNSRVKIKFITFPALIGLTYKMNFFDFLYPYVGAGPGVFFFYETRSDGAGSSRGYSFGNWFVGGVNLGLDWISRSSSWDRFQSSGIKHSYLSIEYSRQVTFPGGLVDMEVSGLAVGFNFEI